MERNSDSSEGTTPDPRLALGAHHLGRGWLEADEAARNIHFFTRLAAVTCGSDLSEQGSCLAERGMKSLVDIPDLCLLSLEQAAFSHCSPRQCMFRTTPVGAPAG